MPVQYFNLTNITEQEIQEQIKNTYNRANELIKIINVMSKYLQYDMYNNLEMKCLIMILKYLIEYLIYIVDNIPDPVYEAWMENIPDCMLGDIEFVENRLKFIGITDYCEEWVISHKDIIVDYIEFSQWLYDCSLNSKERDSELIAILDELDTQYHLLLV